MGRVGSIELYTSANGWIEVDLYEPGDFAFEPVEMRTASGVWGVPYLTSTGDADTPLEIYTSANGWMGIHSTGFVTIEDWEDGDSAEWVAGGGGGQPVVTGRAAYSGSYGVRLDDTDSAEAIASWPGKSTALPEYPSSGETWEFYINFETDAALEGPVWHKFGCQTHPTTDNFSTDYTSEGYRVSIFPGSGNFSVGRIDANNDYVTFDTMNETFGRDQWYRVVVDWHDSASDQVTAEIGSVAFGQFSSYGTVSITDTTYTGSGAIEFGGTTDVEMDTVRKLPQ